MLREKAAVLPVPDCDWAIMLEGGLMSSKGRAFSWILEGLRKFMARMPLRSDSDLGRVGKSSMRWSEYVQVELLKRFRGKEGVVRVGLHVREPDLDLVFLLGERRAIVWLTGPVHLRSGDRALFGFCRSISSGSISSGRRLGCRHFGGVGCVSEDVSYDV